MAETQISAGGSHAAPLEYVVASTEEFTLLAVNANFDGTAAGAAWLPAVEVVSDSGQVVARHITGATVAAGGSAEVTFAPFLRSAAAAAAAGIQFDVDNVGDWLSIEATSTEPGGYSIALLADDTMSIFAANLLTILAGPVVIHSDDIELLQRHTTGVFLVNTRDINQTATRNFTVDASTLLKLSGGSVELYPAFGFDALVKTQSGHMFKVLDHLSNPIFEVRDDASVHIKTGTAIIADL